MSRKGHKGNGQDALVRVASYVLMVSSDGELVRDVADLMRAFKACALVTFESVEVLVQSVPRSSPALAILADAEPQGGTERALGWLKRSWPRCRSVVVSAAVDKRMEVAARRCGALYFVRPVSQAEWLAILDIGLQRSEIANSEVLDQI